MLQLFRREDSAFFFATAFSPTVVTRSRNDVGPVVTRLGEAAPAARPPPVPEFPELPELPEAPEAPEAACSPVLWPRSRLVGRAWDERLGCGSPPSDARGLII